MTESTENYHIDTRLLVGYISGDVQLTDKEHGHLVKCEVCQQRLTDVGADSLREQSPLPAKEPEHLPKSLLVAFLLEQAQLTEPESRHLARCEFCMRRMADATGEKL